MAKQVQLRRGTTAELSSVTGAEGEVIADTTKDTLTYHDGYTAGGVPLLRQDFDNAAAGSLAIDKISVSGSTAGYALTTNSTNDGLEWSSLALGGDLSGTTTNAQIVANAVGAGELNVSGNGTAGQALLSDGDGSLSWGLAGGVIAFDSAQSGEEDTWSVGNSFYPATRYSVQVTTTSSTDIVILQGRMNWSLSDNDDEIGFSWAISTDGSSWSRITSQGIIGNQSGLTTSFGTTTGQHNGSGSNVLMGNQFGVMDAVYVPGSVGTFYFTTAIDGNTNTGCTVYNNRFASNGSSNYWDRRGSSCVTATLIAGDVRV